MKYCDMCSMPSICSERRRCRHAKTPAKETPSSGSERRLVSGLSDYEKSRLLHHLLQKREWDGLNGRPWDEHLHGQAEREIQMLVSR